jgi:hypothetical protein
MSFTLVSCLSLCLRLASHDLAADPAAAAPKVGYSGPIIDVHLHTGTPRSAVGRPNPVTGVKSASTAQELCDATPKECRKHRIVRAVLNAHPGTAQTWVKADAARFLVAPMVLERDAQPVLKVEALRAQLQAGEAAAIGELMTQYAGVRPDDGVLEPYWKLAEDLDVPVMVHTGTSFPGTAYAGYPRFRLSLGNPMLLEEVLVRHPKLRLWIAHGGQPWKQETFALMAQYPQLYMEISTISWIGGTRGRPAFHAFLREAVDRGLGRRIMFGSDQMAWPDAIGLAIDGVDSAEFLSAEQKREIFYQNAVRFLRLKEPLD